MTTRWVVRIAAAGIASCFLGATACVVGPVSIAAGRGVYNEVINRTEDEQLLSMLVHDRYDETYGMLAVASVTANIRASANVRGQFGLSRSNRVDYDGNLVPLDVGLAYEENPTISYVPLGGEKFIQSLLTPMGIDELVLISQFLPRRYSMATGFGLSRINGLRNPLMNREGDGSQDFVRLARLMRQLRIAGASTLARYPDGTFAMMLHPETDEDEQRVAEILELTGIDVEPRNGGYTVPLVVAPAGWVEDALNVQTLSVMEMLRLAGASIDIPAEHLEEGVVEAVFNRTVTTFMRIKTSKARPKGEGAVAIRYRGYWYYIDDADSDSKQAFLFLRTLVGLRLYDRDKKSAAPVLTIPVG